MFLKTLVMAASLSFGLVSVAVAQELPKQRSSWVQMTFAARYERLPADVQGGHLQLEGRALVGKSLGYGLGFNLQLGTVGGEFSYLAELMPVGLGLRFGDSGVVLVGLGLGVGGVGGGDRSSALLVPIELRARGQLGPLRVFGVTTARSAPLTDTRELQFEGSVALGWGRQKSYWPRASAGSGPYVALGVQDVGDERAVSISIGLELLGAN